MGFFVCKLCIEDCHLLREVGWLMLVSATPRNYWTWKHVWKFPQKHPKSKVNKSSMNWYRSTVKLLDISLYIQIPLDILRFSSVLGVQSYLLSFGGPGWCQQKCTHHQPSPNNMDQFSKSKLRWVSDGISLAPCSMSNAWVWAQKWAPSADH